ncbi:MFS transporter [Planococcus salinus]|uniref:MFS transporter n=1 Tax=Planococcus salinus TaxID=1848460 RepID=A0A3M8P4H6_9BACL|nr:MFS transporter [Planococcus salinus]RNF38555.1 MFS transporter [Planococcus salinus]
MDEAMKVRRATYHLYTFTVSKVISTFGSSVYAFGISLYILALTGSAASFALNLICSILPRAVMAPFAGYAADRYPKKVVVILSQTISIVSVGGLLVYSITAGLSLAAIYTATALVSASSMFTSVAFSSAIANLIDPDRIQRAMGFNQSAVAIATIGGPVVGGMLFGFVSIHTFLTIQVAAYSIAVVMEATMDFQLFTRRLKENLTKADKTVRESMKEGIFYVKSNRPVMVIVTVALGVNFFFSALMIGLPFIAVQQLGVKATHFGFIEGMIAGGMLLASVYFSIRKEVKFPLLFAKRGVLSMAVLLSGLGLPLIIELPYPVMVSFYLMLMLTFGITNVFVNTPIGVMIQKEVVEEYRGRVLGIVESMAMAMMPLGYLLFGLLFDLMPAEYVVISSSVCLILMTNYLMRPSVLEEAHPDLAAATQIRSSLQK